MQPCMETSGMYTKLCMNYALKKSRNFRNLEKYMKLCMKQTAIFNCSE